MFCEGAKLRVGINPNIMAAKLLARYSRSPRTKEGVKNNVTFDSKQLDKPYREQNWESSTMSFVTAFRSYMKDVCGVSLFTSDPVGYLFAETTSYFGCVSPLVGFAQVS